ncbi:ferrous iron transport protein A [Ruminococcus sp. OA3]|uniref:FeoA family protein n=1 Tax=Ruminococcus sp. OA3 TaxID=2914164 RepID=UPI001F05D392|nr:FeoA family protein [Ruminococcus sp. OA3]MCH1983972.1 ferrous iron transport protein A [Ruminococcus sp. OA3]
MKLIEGEVDSSYRVVRMDLPLNVDRRLEALGMTGDSRVLVMNKKKRGAMVIKVRGTRFAIGKSIAEHIEVREDDSDGQ